MRSPRFLMTRAMPTANRTKVHFAITGTEGRLSFVPYGDEIIKDTISTSSTERLPEGHRGSRTMVAEFLRCILEDREPPVTGEMGLDDLSVVLATYRSAEQGIAVSPARS